MAIDREERAALALLACVGGLGNREIAGLKAKFGSATEALGAGEMGWVKAGLSEKKVERLKAKLREVTPEDLLEDLEESGVEVVTVFDGIYPKRLVGIASAPYVLFVRGRLEEGDWMAIAIVGTRKPTSYGRASTEKIAHYLGMNGVIVISGLALGVDAVAHRAALESGGRTIAVLGNGIDRIHPVANAQLGRMIERSGAVVSEYPPGYPALRQNFPARNRLISGMSLAVVVVEGAAQSGARITAEFARKQGRLVMAVPGSVDNPMAQATNELIREGAVLVRDGRDVLEELGKLEDIKQKKGKQKQSPVELGSSEEQVVFDKITQKPMTMDELVGETGLSLSQVLQVVSLMEIGRVVRRRGDGKIEIVESFGA